MAVSTKRRATSSANSDFSPSPSPPPATTRSAKKPNRSAAASSSSTSKFSHVFAAPTSSSHNAAPAALPARSHGPTYHRPLLVDEPPTILALSKWFEGVSAKRDMPWRAAFINPSEYSSATELREARKKRAYQVWISEIMLQQTRVETVKSYWLNWMAKWPTIEALASAPEEEVLAAWRGLGYYSRATRIHTAAKQVVADPSMDGLLPETPSELEKSVPGVGPYTAGAISSIVFGQPVPILDGNVARVLSRQLGLYANPKAKITTDLMWAAADVLVKKAYEVGEEKGTVPGEWNQALMELGSTVCTPLKPGCGACPIRPTCRAYSEAEASTTRGKSKEEETETAVVDMEDLCTYCEPFPFEEEAEAASNGQSKKETAKQEGVSKLRQATLSFGFSAPVTKAKGDAKQDAVQVTQAIESRIRKYPMKLEKKKIRQEECLVCAIERPSGEYLLEQRPATGLLANMWQFPSLTISTTAAGPSDDKEQVFPDVSIPKLIDTFVASLIDAKIKSISKDKFGSITHIFSHLHLTMHLYKIVLPSTTASTHDDMDGLPRATKKAKVEETAEKNKNFGSKLGDTAPRRWADAAEVEAETMGTGMRNCWLALQTEEKRSGGLTRSGKAASKTKR